MSQGRDGRRKERQEEIKGGCRAPSTQEMDTTMEVGYAALSLDSVMPTWGMTLDDCPLCLRFLLMKWDGLGLKRRSRDITEPYARSSEKMMRLVGRLSS